MSKNFGIETSFTRNRKTAKPGYISSTQYGIVTGTHAVEVIGDKDLYRTGRAVYLHDFSVEDGCGTVSIITDPDKTPLGVLAMSHAYTPEGLFHDGDVANIITFGCVYMVCSSDMEYDKIHFGKQVSIVRNWGSVVNADNEKISPANTIKTRWYFTGAVEFGAYDVRFGRVNVAEVMVVPGSAVSQNGGAFTPKYGSHRKVGDTSWPGDIGHTYLLKNDEVSNGETVNFEGYVDMIPYLNHLMADDPERFNDIESIKRVSWSYDLDKARQDDAIIKFGSTDPVHNVNLDLTDGKGEMKVFFGATRRKFDPKIPTWCTSYYVMQITYKAASGRPTQNIPVSFDVRFEV